MFESNLISQINTQSKLPTFVEVQVVQSLNASLRKACQFVHVLIAEKSDIAARLLPYDDELYLVGSALIERLLIFHADTTFTELMFGLRRGSLVGPAARGPRAALDMHSLTSWLKKLRWWVLGPRPSILPEERAMRYVNDGPAAASSPAASWGGGETGEKRSGAVAAGDALASADAAPLASEPSLASDLVAPEAMSDLSAEELLHTSQASYGHLRFRPLTYKRKLISLILLTLKPYLEKKMADWYAAETDDSEDSVTYREAYARRYPNRALVKKFIATYMYPTYYVLSSGSDFLYQMCYLLELTPYTSAWHRIFGIVLRRGTADDNLAATSPNAKRALLMARVLLLLIFFGFRLLDLSRNSDVISSAARSDGTETLPIPPPPQWGIDNRPGTAGPVISRRGSSMNLAVNPAAVQESFENNTPEPGCCPVCKRRVTNAAVCTASGVVGCYPCLQQHIREHKKCPVTLKSATVEQIRRIYES